MLIFYVFAIWTFSVAVGQLEPSGYIIWIVKVPYVLAHPVFTQFRINDFQFILNQLILLWSHEFTVDDNILNVDPCGKLDVYDAKSFITTCCQLASDITPCDSQLLFNSLCNGVCQDALYADWTSIEIELDCFFTQLLLIATA